MRPLLPILALVLLLATGLGTGLLSSPAHAAEAKPPAKPKVDTRAAGEIGRGLLSTRADIRAKAVARLVTHIQKIDAERGDLGAFLDAMTKATHAWADRHERLMEVWLDQAVNGSAAERRRAVRLLTALGEKAVTRLAAELRHERRHGDEAPPAESESLPQDDGDLDAPFPHVVAGTPIVYDLKDLFARGMNAVQLRSLCLKAADAVTVKQFNSLFVVTAAQKGHELLQEKLHDVRVAGILEAKSKAERSAEEKSKAAPGKVTAPSSPAGARGESASRTDDAPDGEDESRVDEKTNRDDPAVVNGTADVPAQPRAAKKIPMPAADDARRWTLEPTLFHVPGPALDELRQRKTRSGWSRLLPSAFLASDTTLAIAGTHEHVSVWSGALRRVPDARAGLPLRGIRAVATGQSTTVFAGKQIHYSKTVRRTKGGAWGIVTGTIPHGITLELRVVEGLDGPTVRVTATHTEVGLPMPVVRVQPSPKAAAVELERPEWSTTRSRTRVRLGKDGGGGFISLPGLSTSQDEHVVLVFTLKPAPPAVGAVPQKRSYK